MALASLKLVSDKKLHYIFKNALSLKEALDLLSIAAHPKEDYRLYILEINSLKSRNFNNIESYVENIKYLVSRANMCLYDTELSSITNREIFEYFLKGLSFKEQEYLEEKDIMNIENALIILHRRQKSRKNVI
ncbi:hypothetical protein DMUE_1923 [Dictyocoela muelleri]|nr:hypothetical protein DMUE_1923 [Dictyocoela muelleri]